MFNIMKHISGFHSFTVHLVLSFTSVHYRWTQTNNDKEQLTLSIDILLKNRSGLTPFSLTHEIINRQNKDHSQGPFRAKLFSMDTNIDTGNSSNSCVTYNNIGPEIVNIGK